MMTRATLDTEPSTRLTTKNSTLEDQAHPVVEIWATLRVVEEPSRTTMKTESSLKHVGIDQIVMMVKQLLESTYKWKDEHDEEAEQS